MSGHVRMMVLELILEADPWSQTVVVIVFARVVCTSVPTFQNLSKQNKVQARIVIIDVTHVLTSAKGFIYSDGEGLGLFGPHLADVDLI